MFEARTARRAVGAKLQPHVIVPQAVETAFDSSRLRREIQLGLRVARSMRTGSAREAKAPAATKACRLTAGLYLKATDFHALGQRIKSSQPQRSIMDMAVQFPRRKCHL